MFFFVGLLKSAAEAPDNAGLFVDSKNKTSTQSALICRIKLVLQA
ncbi:MAG: hypothetical protein RLZZ419_484 [Pseudomonadota bacterium]|jgi:hypothetical protein